MSELRVDRRRFASIVLTGALGAAGALAAAGQAAAASPLRFGVATPGGPWSSAEVAEVTRLAGEPPSIEMWYADFRQPFPTAGVQAAASRGSTPLITWEPWRWGGGISQPAYALARIASGDHDAYLQQWGQALRAYGRPVTIRFAHEMNGNWYPWAEGVNGNGRGEYVAAWRHVHRVVRSAGGTNASWMWCPNVPYDGSVPMGGLYPGANYVNVAALDGYNWGTTQPWSTWTAPRDVFGPGLAQLRSVAPRKSIVIAETASAEAGGSKPDWITALVPYLVAEAQVTGFVWFHFNKENDWRINSSAASATAFARALAARR